MPRLIILLLTLASLTVLTVQNLGEDKAVSLVVLGTPLSSIPLGLLILGAVGTGTLTTLVLYGLVGLYRPADSATKSKYKPMGTRVPYPDTSSVPPTGASYASPDTASTAFVTEPPIEPNTSQPIADKAGSPPVYSSDSTTAQSGTPTTPSNVYSPFSRNDTAKKKKKGSTPE